MSELPAEFASPPPTVSTPPSVLLNRKEAAAYISARIGGAISVGTLARLASDGAGPPYRMWGGRRGGQGRWAVYRPADLDAWIESQLCEPAA